MSTGVNVLVVGSLLCMVCLAAVPKDELHVTVTPPKFRPGQTKAVTINCSFLKARVPSILSVASLRIVESTTNAVVAKINVFNVPPTAQAVMSTVNVKGDLNGAFGGYLSVTWPNPTSTHGLLFTCEAELIGTAGQAVRANKTAPLDIDRTPVTTAAPTTPSPATYQPIAPGPQIGQNQNNQAMINSLKNIIRRQSATIKQLSANCPPTTTPSPATPAPTTRVPFVWTPAPTNTPWAPWWTPSPTQAPPATPAATTRPPYVNPFPTRAPVNPFPTPAPVTPGFIPFVTPAPATPAPATPAPTGQIARTSSPHQGHRYMLSTAMESDQAKGESLCTSLGGYLAEISDRPEFDFVGNFIASTQFVEQIYIGVHYSAQAKDFYYTHSHGPAVFTNWDPSSMQPHPEGGRHCTVIIPTNNMYMSSTVCRNAFKRRYICEVP